MSWNTWWLYFVTVFLLSGAPGPNMLHILSRSVSLGVNRAIPAMLGCLAALVVMLVGSALGLGAVLLASPKVFEVLQYVGAAYLIWLGIKAWREETPDADNGTAMASSVVLTNRQIFQTAFVISISNPKLLLFAAAFLPQFVNPSSPKIPQFAVLVATFSLCELFWYAVYGLGGNRLRHYLLRPALRRMFDRLTGVMFVGFGIMLLRFRPQS
jgi:threonine/homoserine/homoserine lactone efflux protein